MRKTTQEIIEALEKGRTIEGAARLLAMTPKGVSYRMLTDPTIDAAAMRLWAAGKFHMTVKGLRRKTWLRYRDRESLVLEQATLPIPEQPAKGNGTFFYVYNPGGNKPQVKHPTKDEAFKEAERVAVQTPGQVVLVLQCVKAFKSVPRVEEVEYA